jgi:hypothetical protein
VGSNPTFSAEMGRFDSSVSSYRTGPWSFWPSFWLWFVRFCGEQRVLAARFLWVQLCLLRATFSAVDPIAATVDPSGVLHLCDRRA